jgi:hypothetical protein
MMRIPTHKLGNSLKRHQTSNLAIYHDKLEVDGSSPSLPTLLIKLDEWGDSSEDRAQAQNLQGCKAARFQEVRIKPIKKASFTDARMDLKEQSERNPSFEHVGHPFSSTSFGFLVGRSYSIHPCGKIFKCEEKP